MEVYVYLGYMNVKTLYEFMADHDISVKEMAEKLGMSPRSLSTYKGTELPDKKQRLADKVTREWFNTTTLSTPPDANVIHCKLEGERKQTWTDADLIENGELTEYAKKRLDRIAALANEALTPAPKKSKPYPPSPILNNRGLINEDSTTYRKDK